MADLNKLLDHQRQFNRLIWNPSAKTESEVIERIKHLMLGMYEEGIEFLRTFEYKPHRRYKGRLQNVAHSHEELMDMFKYWLSLADVSEFPIERLEELYYAKSLVVQQRYQEEWLNGHQGPSVVVDIDEVLADYRNGMCSWAKEWGPALLKLPTTEQYRFVANLERIVKTGLWINHETLGLTTQQWQILKHDYRTRGGKRTMPVFKDAKPFLEWCRSKGWAIILITSRPIDKYPNLFSDTVGWLTENQLPYDFLWWAGDKAERLEEAHIVLRSQIVFAVDDSNRFVEQFRSKGVRTYHLNRYDFEDLFTPLDVGCQVRSLDMLVQYETEWQKEKETQRWHSTTQNTDPTQSTPEKNRRTLSPEDPRPSTSDS